MGSTRGRRAGAAGAGADLARQRGGRCRSRGRRTIVAGGRDSAAVGDRHRRACRCPGSGAAVMGHEEVHSTATRHARPPAPPRRRHADGDDRADGVACREGVPVPARPPAWWPARRSLLVREARHAGDCAIGADAVEFIERTRAPCASAPAVPRPSIALHTLQRRGWTRTAVRARGATWLENVHRAKTAARGAEAHGGHDACDLPLERHGNLAGARDERRLAARVGLARLGYSARRPRAAASGIRRTVLRARGAHARASQPQDGSLGAMRARRAPSAAARRGECRPRATRAGPAREPRDARTFARRQQARRIAARRGSRQLVLSEFAVRCRRRLPTIGRNERAPQAGARRRARAPAAMHARERAHRDACAASTRSGRRVILGPASPPAAADPERREARAARR